MDLDTEIQQAINKNKLIVIAGPTASGKTAKAIELAKKYNGELINADSRQIYKDLSIGTNVGDISNDGDVIKIETKYSDSFGKEITEISNLPVLKIESIPIHLIQFLDPTEKFDVSVFKRYAEFLIEDIRKRNKVPIVVGGTGLYIDALLKKSYVFESEEIDFEEREILNKKSREELQKIVKTENVNKWKMLNNSDKNNPVRLVRIIEKTRSDSFREVQNDDCIEYLMLYPGYDWDELKEKIKTRAHKMFDDGLVQETKLVLEKYGLSAIALQGIGYKEVVSYLNKKNTLEESKQKVARSHTQYARRQRIWFEGDGRGYNLMKF